MRRRMARFALVVGLALARSAAGYTVGIDYREHETAGGPAVTSQANCGLAVAGFGVGVFEGSGVGVWGGLSDREIDGGEAVAFRFPFPATTRQLRYTVAAASNVDGDGLDGEHLLEGFDAGGVSLGVVARSGVGVLDATGAFGGARLQEIEITAQEDGLTVGRVEYRLDAGVEAQVRFGLFAPLATPELEVCGLRVASSTGSVGVNDQGLFAHDGPADVWTDAGQWLDIAFDTPVAGVQYSFADATDDDADGKPGEHLVEAFDAAGASLGVRPAQGSFVALSLPGYFGEVALSRILLTGADRFRVETVHVVPEPGGGSWAAAAAALALAARRRLH
jgi:hypothetical protein